MVKIHRESVKSDFLGISNTNWQAAARDLGAHATMLYLYLASNANGFELALSQKAVTDAIGMPRSTYHDQFHKLVSKGYLVLERGNTYAFYEKPQPRPDTQDKNTLSSHGLQNPPQNNPVSSDGQNIPSKEREINKINIINNNTNIMDSLLDDGYHEESPTEVEAVPNPREESKKGTVNLSQWQNEKGEFIF